MKSFRSVRISVCSQVWWGYPLQRGFLFGEDEHGLWIYPSHVKPKDGRSIRILRPFGRLSVWRSVDPVTKKPVTISVKDSQTARDIMMYFSTVRPTMKPQKGTKAPARLGMRLSNLGQAVPFIRYNRDEPIPESTESHWAVPLGGFGVCSYDDNRIDMARLAALADFLDA